MGADHASATVGEMAFREKFTAPLIGPVPHSSPRTSRSCNSARQILQALLGCRRFGLIDSPRFQREVMYMVTRRWFDAVSTAVHVMVVVCVMGVGATLAGAQGLGGAGTIQGVVKDPTGGVMQSVTLTLTNPVSGFKRDGTTDNAGRFVFGNLPPNPYHVVVEAQGFQRFERDVDVRTGVPIELTLTLQLAGATTEVQVVGHAEDLLERDPTAHTDIDQSLIDKLPSAAGGGLNQVVMMASPGVVADSNGFFHPIGDHAQTQFSIDNQPVTDQQSRIYSNQM